MIAKILLCTVIFAMIDSKNFAMIAKFLYHSENFSMIAKMSLSLQNFRYHCEIFSMPWRNCHSSMLLPASSRLHFSSSSLLFLHPRLDEIDENSYELGINQHNCDAKLDMMVEVYETCKTTKNNLETKSEVRNGPAHVNRLN